MDEQEKAVSCLQRAGQELRDPDALYHLGMCLLERDPEEAEQAFTSAAGESPLIDLVARCFVFRRRILF